LFRSLIVASSYPLVKICTGGNLHSCLLREPCGLEGLVSVEISIDSEKLAAAEAKDETWAQLDGDPALGAGGLLMEEGENRVPYLPQLGSWKSRSHARPTRPGVVWRAIEDAPDAGTYRGYEGVRGYWQDWLDDFDMHEVKIEESIEPGDRLVCVQRGAATGKGSGVRSEIHYACVYTFGADERVVEVNEYATRKEALAAAQMEP